MTLDNLHTMPDRVADILAEPPNNFRGSGSEHFLGQRIVEDNERLQKLKSIVNDHIAEKTGDIDKVKYRKKFLELIIHNAYGRNFPVPDSSSDFAAVIDPEKAKDTKYENCIVLTEVVINGEKKLSLAGGFCQVGEAMTQTARRKLKEKTGASTVSDCVFFGEESKPNRDEREDQIIISSCISGLVDVKELDRNRVYIVPLIGKDFEINDDFIDSPGRLVDVDGKVIEHQGMRGDHGDIVKKLYDWWEHHSKIVKDNTITHLSLAETLKKESHTVPQEWFNYDQEYPGGYEKVTIDGLGGGEYTKTPNIQFVLEHAEHLFREYGLDDAEKSATARASRFVLDLVKADLLPEYPQQSVTVDCILLKKDKLIVQKKKDGTLALPGSFYSPDPKDAKRKGQNILSFAQELIAKKLGLDFRPRQYLGTVGGKVALKDHLADSRYPRLSHVYAGEVTSAFKVIPGKKLDDGSELVEIEIWKDKENGILSDEILYGLDGKGWSYEHNKEIIIPLLVPILSQALKMKKNLTASQIIRR